MAEVILITGGNLGNVAETLHKAKEAIEKGLGAVCAESTIMESAPWGFDAEERFLNQVLVVESEFAPVEILEITQLIERELGRRSKTTVSPDGRTVYESRNIDIDILYYDDLVMKTERLTIPHPEIDIREFVLRPLCEVAPHKIDPQKGKCVEELYNDFKDNK